MDTKQKLDSANLTFSLICQEIERIECESVMESSFEDQALGILSAAIYQLTLGVALDFEIDQQLDMMVQTLNGNRNVADELSQLIGKGYFQGIQELIRQDENGNWTPSSSSSNG